MWRETCICALPCTAGKQGFKYKLENVLIHNEEMFSVHMPERIQQITGTDIIGGGY